MRQQPTTYFGVNSGVGLALRAAGERAGAPLKVGIVRLGVGTLAAHGRQGDVFRFYEIDPAVERVARSDFTFLSDSPAKSEVVLGDARLTLEREPPQDYDAIVLDAFSSDAIPVHLLTAEAIELYLRHLRSDGVLAVHISNRHLDLRPVLAAAADRFGLEARYVRAVPSPEARLELESWWVLLARPGGLVRQDPTLADASDPLARHVPPCEARLWTDEWSNLFELLKD